MQTYKRKSLFGLSTIDVRRLSYDLAERLGLNYCFNSERKMAGTDWFYNFLRRQGTLSVRTPQATSISRIVGFNRSKVDLFFRIYEDEAKTLTSPVCGIWMRWVSRMYRSQTKLLVQRGRGRWQESQARKEALLSLLPVP